MTEDIGRRRELTKREKKSRDLGEVPSAIGKKKRKKKEKKKKTREKRRFRQRNVVLFQAKLTFTNRMACTLHCKSHNTVQRYFLFISSRRREGGDSLTPSEWYMLGRICRCVV